MMKREVKEKWVAALRSGAYKQGTLALRTLDANGNAIAYCCLGVLCDLYSRETGEGQWGEHGEFITEGVAEHHWLPQPIRLWAGLDSRSGKLPEGIQGRHGTYRNLSQLNDNARFSFEQIASVIEEQF